MKMYTSDIQPLSTPKSVATVEQHVIPDTIHEELSMLDSRVTLDGKHF